MARFAPNPRYRIYKSERFYSRIASEIATGKWKRGDDVQRLEDSLCKKLNVPFALATAQARVAIHLAIKTIVEQTGKRNIVLSPYTIFDVINVVISAGGRPVFADLAPGTCNVDAAAVEALCDDETAAVMVTHLQGLACDIQRIAAHCNAKGIMLVEDASQGMSCQVGGKQVGTFGDIGIFSFGLAKNINCVYGGTAVTKSAELRQHMAAFEQEFPEPSASWIVKKTIGTLVTDVALTPILFKTMFFWLFRYGYLHDVEFLNKRVTVEDDPILKSEFPGEYRRRMTPLQARLVLDQLPHTDRLREIRKANANVYYEGLKDLAEIVLPPYRRDNSHAYLQFPIQVEDRHALVRYLMRNRRDVAIQHLKNCADLECFSEYARDCPVARQTANNNLLLPTYPSYGQDEVFETTNRIRAYFGMAPMAIEATPELDARPALHLP